MSDEALFEKWRRDRSQFDPTEGFADRVLQEIQGLPLPSKALPDELSPIGTAAKANRWSRFARFVLGTAAGLAALFRIVELLSVFSATGIDN